ncbi:Protoporphyrinogen oxidase 2 [Durusdinium trenchii]|uniref:Chloroplastic/mitochondrial (PPO2) (Protein MATERNAL EFFECT EMBRYO ARREST 61) n=1 Tax=Durusdinium trenchii TaxID=1381693 RepID=A0ABP0RZB8_9DINO
MDKPVIVVGAGLAGLTCCHRLHAAGVPFQLLESDARPGGRVQTDTVRGYRLDRGFQVLLTAYPEVQAQLDLAALQLCRFRPGALIRYGGRFHRLSDPWRELESILATTFNPIGSIFDKLRIMRLRTRATRGTLEELWTRPERTTLEVLREIGFSDAMIDRFLRPFLGGIFLESELNTSSRMLDFVFRMFSIGDAALPAGGMGEIPLQLAGTLPPGSIRYDCPVKGIVDRSVLLENGESMEASSIVIATGGVQAAQLLGRSVPAGAFHSVTCLHFAVKEAPINKPILVLNGEGTGPVNNLCVPSLVSRDYAPRGHHLVSATVLGNPECSDEVLTTDVLAQMASWFGDVSTWDHLRTDRIPHALPVQAPGAKGTGIEAQPRDGVFVCGDHVSHGSTQAAMESGRLTAEMLLADR